MDQSYHLQLLLVQILCELFEGFSLAWLSPCFATFIAILWPVVTVLCEHHANKLNHVGAGRLAGTNSRPHVVFLTEDGHQNVSAAINFS